MVESILGKVRNEAREEAYRNYRFNYAEISQAELDEAYEKGLATRSYSRLLWFSVGVIATALAKLLYSTLI